MNDIRELMQDAVASPPSHDTDLGVVLRTGRQRVRRRRAGLAAGVAAVVTVGTGAGALTWAGTDGSDGNEHVANQTVPRPAGPVQHLAGTPSAVEGTDYDVLATHTNKHLDQENGQYYDGVTDDGLIVFRDGPHGIENTVRTALLDPATGTKDWLPAPGTNDQLQIVDLGAERLVFVGTEMKGEEMAGPLTAYVFDRSTRTWSSITWPALGAASIGATGVIGPDGRLYVGLPATQGKPPPGGWPTQPGGDAEDAGAEGDTQSLWSVSLTDKTDVRDEHLRFGDLAFTDEAMVWTDRTNGVNDRIHVRDLATGKEHDFDPQSGERCNLLNFGATGDRIVLSQYCGTYDDGRDDRVQVVGLDGELVTTIQGDGIDGKVAGGEVMVTSYDRQVGGTFVYEPDTGRFVRVTDAVSSYGVGGPSPDGYLLWDTPYGQGQAKVGDGSRADEGATQTLARWR